MRVKLTLLLASALFLGSCRSTSGVIVIPKNEYGLEVVDTGRLYRRLVEADPSKEMVELAAVAPQLLVEVRYATENNFMKMSLYPYAAAYLRRGAASSLASAADELRKEGLGLKIWDGYRPYEITRKMWEPYQNPDYVADPAKGSRHNRGAAVDVTLVDLRSGRELEMPTAYDDFTPKAAHSFTDLSEAAIANRAKLRSVMEKHGFVALPSEWWHYDFAGWERFELMDVPFDDIF